MDPSLVTFDYIKQNSGKNPDEVLIDVREPKELEESGKIPHSINIPLGTLENAFSNMPEEQFKTNYGINKPKKENTIIVHCKMGGRSAKAQILLRGLGYTDVKNYLGGFSDWAKHMEG
ncbi:rhodanese domain-containing protein CG4456-like [Anthonomus grandis grandis]|uniref:rhodanese domain-containing protein CG4456-like n=1 Tax=Anthonomus grandis grandis TaxID=2921223 RepID=UPI00216686F2|nr:rhodanese domain-containing protein CG4456-like [Anthonomus grandis grandis]